jgi:hypothetical protein
MGVLFDLVIADDGAAEAVGTTDHLFENFRVFPTKMLDQVTLDGLFSLLDPASAEIESWWKVPLYEAEDVLWVYQLPHHFVEMLASLLENERSRLAQRWAQTGELDQFYDRKLSPEEKAADIRKLVDEMSAFAFDAVERGKCVFLRITL